MPVAAPKKLPVLINRNFTLLWIGQSISNVGDFFFSTTLYMWIATQLARGQSWAPLAVSGVALAMVVPSLVVGPIAGVFVDRWDKRQTMMRMDVLVSSLLLMMVFVSLPFFAGSSLSTVWLLGSIYGVVVFVSVCSQFFNPSRLALIGDIVAEPYRSRATGLTAASFNLALIIGPSLAAPLYFAFGVRWAIGLDMLSFLVSFLAILAIRAPESATSIIAGHRGNFLREFVEGLRFYKGNKVLVVLLIAGILFQLGAGPSDALNVLFAIQNLHTPKDLIGFFEANYGAGMIIGLLLAAFFARRMGEARLFWLSLTCWGIFMFVLGRMTNFVFGFALFFLLGLCNAGIAVVVGPLTLRVTPREFVGRVQAVLMPTVIASSLLSTVLAGLLASTLLRGLHTSLLGSTFGPLDTIFSGTGLIVISAGVYVLVALRDVKLPEEEVIEEEVVGAVK